MYILICVSISYVLATAHILEGLKPTKPEWLNVFLRCNGCLGFWIGLLVFIFTDYKVTGEIYFDPFISSFSNFVVMVFIEMLYSIGGKDGK